MKTPSLSLLASLVCAFSASAAKPPNVLLILVDDLRPALGTYGDKHARTPNLDRLAASGTRFDLAFCNTAVCAPSRFNLMTGARSTSLGIYGFDSDFRRRFPDAVTLTQHFMRHGYTAESLGKTYHIGHGCHGDPASWSSEPFKDLVIEYLTKESTDGAFTREQALFSNQSAAGLPRGAAWEMPDVADDAYADGRVANEACRRLAAAAARPDKPFFLVTGFARPHLPFSVPRKYWDLYDPAKLPMPEIEVPPKAAPGEALKRDGEIAQYKPVPERSAGIYQDGLKRKLIHGYYAGVSYADAQIGKVLEALDRTGLAKDTVVVLWGDHGYLLGELGMWTKHVNYEMANRIPLIVRAPGVTKPGTVTRQIAETVDIYPTLAELCGLPKPEGPQPIDGISLVPALKDPEARVKDHAYHCYRLARLGRAIRTERYRLVEWKNPAEPESTAAIELYDYSDGPVERENLAESRPEVVKELRALLAKHPAPVHGPPARQKKATP